MTQPLWAKLLTYAPQFHGAASGISDPAKSGNQSLVGTIRQPSSWECDKVKPIEEHNFGRAASAPELVAGTLSTDKQPQPELDGYMSSAISSHPDGQFALNTAATSTNSLAANLEHMIRMPLSGARALIGTTVDGSRQATVDAHRRLRSYVTGIVAASELPPQRNVRGVFVAKDPSDFHSGEFNVIQLATIGFGTLLAGSLLARL